MGDILVLELPDMTAKLGAFPLGRMLEVRGMLAVPRLEVLGDTSVSLNSPVIQPFHRSFIYNISGCTSPRQGTVLFLGSQTITSVRVVVVVDILLF